MGVRWRGAVGGVACLLAVAACSSNAPQQPAKALFGHLDVAPAFHTYQVPVSPGLVTSIVQDDAGRVLLADHANVYVASRTSGGYTFTPLKPPEVPTWQPTGLAVRDGLLYVADDNGHDVVVLRLTDTASSLVRRITAPQMQAPQNVAVDQDGSLVVADKSAVLRFSASGALQWRTALDRATGVAVSGGFAYASSLANPTIVKVSASGTVVKTTGAPGVSPGRYQLPVGLSAANGRIVVTDAYNGRITVLDQNLGVVAQAGANGGGLDAFNLPFATVATGDGYLVADTYKHRLVRTDRRWVEQEQIVFSRLVPAGRGRPLVFGTDARPRTYPMLPGIDVAGDLGLRSPVAFVGGFDGLDQANAGRTPIHLTFDDPQLGTMGQTWAQRVGEYDVVGSPTNGRLEVIDPKTGMFVYVDVGGDSWWRADGALILPGGLRRSLTDVIEPARAALGRASALLGQNVSRRDAFDRALGNRNWSADLMSPAARAFLASPMTRDDASRYFATALQAPQQRVVELLEVKYLSGS